MPSDPCRKFKAKDIIQSIPPEIAPIPDQVSLIGTQGKIEAKVTGTPAPNIVWKKGSKTLKLDSSKYSFSLIQTSAVLYINNLSEEDAGSYTIEAENIAGFDTKSCKFSVHSPPVLDYDKKFKKQSVVSVGSNFRIYVQVTGCPKPEVVWSKDEFKLKKDDKATVEEPVESQFYLGLKQCDRNDSGVYKIRVSNQFGKAEAKFEVQIVDVPDQPKDPIEINMDQQAKSATLNWKPPKWDGGSELTGYTIEYAKILEPSISKSLNWFKLITVRPTTTSTVMDGLVKNSYYYFRVYAENAIGQSQPLESEQAIEAKPAYSAPSKPTGPLVITNVLQNGCTISWAPPADDGGSRLKSFIVEAREARRANWYQIDTVDAAETSLKISNLIENNTYFFRVSAKNSIGVGDALESDGSIAIRRPVGCPDTPLPLLVTDIQSDNCTLEWKAPAWTGGNDLLGYKVEMKVGEGSTATWNLVSDVAPTSKTYIVKNLAEGNEYYFRISAFNAVGASKPLELNRPVVPKKQITAPSAPNGPISALKCNKDSIAIQWGPPKDNGGAPVTRYVVYCREVNTNNWSRVGIVDAETFSYQVENLTENSDYHFRVVAENYIGPGKHLQTDTPIKARSPYNAPDKPDGPLTIKNLTDKSATISWQKPKNDGGSAITGYLVKRRDVKRPVWVKCGRVSPDTLSLNIKDLVEGSQYVVQVFAENSEGLSVPLELDEPIEPKRKVGAPELPASFECIGVDLDSVTLQWESPVSDGGLPVRSYKLEMCEKGKLATGESRSWQVVKDDIASINTSYSVQDLEEGHEYMFRLSATNDKGTSEVKLLDKAVKPRKTIQPPSQPAGPLKVISMEDHSFTIAWSAAASDGGSPIANYVIEVRDAIKGNWKQMATVSSNTTQYKLTDLAENNEYYIRVRARNEVNLTSQPLEVLQAVLVKSPFSVPSGPRDFKLIATGSDKVTLEFKASENDGGMDIRSYIIEKRDANRVTWIKVAKVKPKADEIDPQHVTYTVEVDELLPGASYYFRIVAENPKGRSETCELEDVVKLEKVAEKPSKPLELNILRQKKPNSVSLDWKAPVYDGNDKIKQYVVEHWSSDYMEWKLVGTCEPTETSYVVNNLKDGCTYKFRVRASNKLGESEPSLETMDIKIQKVNSLGYIYKILCIFILF